MPHPLARAARALAFGLLWPLALGARPVSYADGHMLMAEHDADAFHASYTYSPSFRWSASLGTLRHDALGRSGRLSLDYLRAARLLHRWNLPAAQANAFAWGGLGRARTDLGDGIARHIGLQLDYETRRVYTSFVSELHEGGGWSHRFDAASLGWAPYEHDVDRMATWIVLKGTRATNADDRDVKGALFLRFFTTRWWLEAGADEDGRPLANLMLNF